MLEKMVDTILEQKISNDLCKRFKKVINFEKLGKYIKKNGIEETLDCYFFAEDLEILKSTSKPIRQWNKELEVLV